MDIRGQLISVRLRWRPIVGIAVLVAVIVFLVRLYFAPPLYSATLSARVDAPVSSGAQPSETVAFAAATVTGLAQSPGVLSDAMARAGLPLDIEKARERITVAPGRTEGFLTITALAPTDAEATLLVRSMSYALSVRLVEDTQTLATATTTPLRSELDQLTRQLASTRDPGAREGLQQRFEGVNAAVIEVQSRPGIGLLAENQAVVSPDPVSPAPARDAALAFLITVIVLVEGMIVWRAVRGRIPEGDPAIAVAARCDRPVSVLDRRRELAPVLALLYRDRLVDAPGLAVVHLTRRRRVFDVGAALVDTQHAARLAGEPLMIADPADPDDVPGTTTGRYVISLFGRSIDTEDLRTLRVSALPVLVVVDTAQGRAADVGSAVDLVRAADVDVVGVLVWRGSMPRPASTKDGAAATTRHRTPAVVEEERDSGPARVNHGR